MNSHLIETTTGASVNMTRILERVDEQTDSPRRTEYDMMMVDQLRPEQKRNFEILLREAAFGEIVIDWCQMLQKSGIKNFSVHYLPIFSNRRPQALAIFYLVKQLDVTKYLSERWSRWFERLARIGLRPFCFDVGFLEIPFANLPGLLAAPQVDETERVKMMVQIVQYLRTHVSMQALLVKAEPSDTLGGRFAEMGLGRLSFMPNTLLALPYKSFEEYLSSLSRKARWDVKDKMRKFERAGGVIEVSAEPERVAGHIHELYLGTHNANQGKSLDWPMEVTRSVFESLIWLKPDARRVLLARVGDRIVGFLLLVQSGSTLFYKFCGLDYELSPQTMAYFNLFYAGIRYALEHNCDHVSFGPTSYFNKERLGCHLIPVDTYVDVVRGMLRGLRALIALG